MLIRRALGSRSFRASVAAAVAPVVPPATDQQVEVLADAIASCRRCVVLTGAGVSTESGTLRVARLGSKLLITSSACCAGGPLPVRSWAACLGRWFSHEAPPKPRYPPPCPHGACCSFPFVLVPPLPGIPDYRGPQGAYNSGFKPMTHQQVGCSCLQGGLLLRPAAVPVRPPASRLTCHGRLRVVCNAW